MSTKLNHQPKMKNKTWYFQQKGPNRRFKDSL